ncbi:MAG: DNA topoisomerase 3 [Bacteroidota bacterium]
MKVCIAEKPSVAREIAFILGAKAKRDGYFEGNGYAVTWTFGHFCMLKSPDDYQAHWKKWDLNTLPMLPEKFETKLISNSGVKKQFKVIKQLFKTAEVVINCGDAGQEGELIQRWVMKEANYQGPVQRLWISSLTPEAIRTGFQNLKSGQEFDKLFHAGFSRAIGDWLLGMNATRLYTLKFGGYKQLLSIGRVQTPTLAMLVKRHHEIANFKAEPFWELHTLYREVDFQCTKGRFQKKEEGQELLEKVTGKPFTIVSSTRKEGKESPPRLFDLTSLQVHCNKRFGNSADNTLKIAQKLYEQKLITYPRVDTTYLPNDMYPKVPGILEKMKQYQAFIQPLLGKKIRKSSKFFNDKKVTDHHAIIPTGIERQLPAHEQQVYDAIARRFIAAFYPDCLVAKTTVIGESEGVEFKATGKEILDPGWRVLFPKPPKKSKQAEEASDATKEEEEKILPAFVQGESGPHEPTLVEKQTQPPKTYTEASLLRAMETAGKTVDDEELRDLMKANGIGRPSTRANIIETLFKRNYIFRKRKKILPTDMGIQLIDTIQNELLKSAELTGQWEKQLREIESGSYQASTFIHNMKQMVSALIEEVRASSGPRISRGWPAGSPKQTSKPSDSPSPASSAKTKKKSSKKSLSDLRCPKCGQGKILSGKAAYGCSRWKEGCRFIIGFEFKNKKLPETQVIRLIEKGATIQLKGFKENGLPIAGKLYLNEQYAVVFKPAKSQLEPEKKKSSSSSSSASTLSCPKCKKGIVLKGKTAYGCSRWKEGCSFRFPFQEVRQQIGERKATKELVEEILQSFSSS